MAWREDFAERLSRQRAGDKFVKDNFYGGVAQESEEEDGEELPEEALQWLGLEASTSHEEEAE